MFEKQQGEKKLLIIKTSNSREHSKFRAGARACDGRNINKTTLFQEPKS